MDMLVKKPRLEWLDALRGFTMILVVANHVSQMGFEQHWKYSSSLPFLLLFRMPLFFFVSGFLAYRASQVWDARNLGQLIAKKLRVQLIPTAVFFLLFCALMGKNFADSVVVNFHSATKGGYWFTIALLWMFVIYYLFAYSESRLQSWLHRAGFSLPSWLPVTLLFLVALCFYETCFLPKLFPWAQGHKGASIQWMNDICLERVFYHFPFFLFGNIVHRYWSQSQRVMDSRWFFPLVVVVVILSAADVIKWHNLQFEWTNLPSTLAKFGLLIVVFMYFRYYQKYFSRLTVVGSSLQYIGRRTLDIYLIHFFFMPNVPTIGLFFDKYRHNFVLDTTLAVVMALLIIGFCCVSSNILRVSPFLKKWLFGRSMVLLLALLPAAAVAQTLPRDAKLRMGTLPNGLTYYIYPNQTPRGEAVYRLFVKAGSLQERDDQQGLAHFLEHLAFNGTRHFPADGIVRFLESKGAKFGKDLNAHTSFTETVYKLQLPSTDPLMVDSTLTILADWADGLLIDPDEVEKERGVILSEWLSRGGTQTDNSMRLVMELLNGSLYARRITIGDTAIIRHATPQTIRDYYEHWYHPQLMAVAVVGDIDADHVERLISEKFSLMEAPPEGPVTVPVPIPEYSSPAVRIATDPAVKTTTLDMLMLLPQPPAVQTADDYRDYLQRSLMNSLMKLRFNALSFDDPAYAKGAVQYSRFLGATGATDASVELTAGRLRQGICDFITSLRQLFRYGFTQSEIARARKSLLSTRRNKAGAAATVRSAGLMDEIYADYYEGNRLISRADELRLAERFLPAVDSVSMLRLISRTFETRPQHCLLRGGDEVSREIASADDLERLIDSCRQLPVGRYWKNIRVPDALATLQPADHIVSEQPIPAIGATDLRLDNGARVIFRRADTEHDRLTLSAFRKGGQYGLDSTRYYTSLVSPAVISLSGAGDLSREALGYYMAGNSATVHLLVDKLRTGLAASARLADVETMFQLLWLRWTQPRLDTAVCRMTIDKLKQSYRLKQPTPQEDFSRQLGWLLSGRNYTNAVLTDSLVDRAVRPADMLPLHHRFFGPATGYTFVIMADCDLADVRSYISTYIGGLPRGEADTTWVVPPRHMPRRDTLLVSTTGDQPKATVTLAFQQDRPPLTLHPSPLTPHPSPLTHQQHEVYAAALKSVLRAALLKRLREDMGRVYSVSVSVASGRYPSYLCRSTVAFVCQPADVELLTGAVRQELQQLFTSPGLYDAYLDDVRQNLIKEHALQQQQTAYWTTWIRSAVYNNQEDWTWPARYDDVVRALTMDDVAAFARHVLADADCRVEAVLMPAPSAAAPTAAAAPRVAVGTVFTDRNGNGLQDKGEKGLRGIPVSNGDTIVVTDRHGRYTLPCAAGGSLFPILPAGYTLPTSRVVNAGFRYMPPDGGAAADTACADFGLVRKTVNRRFRLNAIGDLQVGNSQELDYALRTLWPELQAPPADGTTALNLFVGDLVNNNLALYPHLLTLMEALPQQSWTVLGNHDRDADSVRWRQTRTYCSTFGADAYAFNEGRVHFIVLNNVYGNGARGYTGRLTDRQLSFVRHDLKYVPDDALIVLSMHIPLAQTANRADLLSLLEGRGDVLALTGHLHQVARYFHQGAGVSVHELSAGAACGFWWVGERGADGVPAALQQCGTPRCYFVVDFDDTRYRLRCKAVGHDPGRQMTLHVTGIDSLDTRLRDLKHLPPGMLLATVYGASDSTRVRCRIDGGEWLTCQKTLLTDPNVARTREMNLLGAYPTVHSRINPMRRQESRQLWTIPLPEEYRRGAHTLEVEATDRWGFSATGRRSFCFPTGKL